MLIQTADYGKSPLLLLLGSTLRELEKLVQFKTMVAFGRPKGI